MFNVFADEPVTGQNLGFFSLSRACDASAVANFLADRGWSVSTDLWTDLVPDAMVSPALYEEERLSRWVAHLPPQPMPTLSQR